MSSATLPALTGGDLLMPTSNPRRGYSGLMETVERLDDIWRLADLLHKSGLIPSSVKTVEAAMAIILEGFELGVSPMLALKQITVIQGKAAASPQLMLALIRRSGLAESIVIEDDGDAAIVTMKRRGEAPHSERFGMDDAARYMTSEGYGNDKRSIRLCDKANWKSQPRIMRKWRAVAACARVVFPDVIGGLYTPDEMGSAAPITDDGQVIDVETVATPAPASLPVPSGQGLFSKEHTAKTRAVADWIKKQVARINGSWHNGDDKGWVGWIVTLEDLQGRGVEAPAKVDDLLNFFQVRNHLFNWAVNSGLLSFGPEIDVKAVQSRQADAYIAQVDRDHHDALMAEVASYVQRKRREATEALYSKHPGMAPEGWAADHAESLRRAVADEGIDAAAG